MVWSQDSYNMTLDFAARAHGAQTVPGKPYSYVVHLANVAMEIMTVLPKLPKADGNLAVQCALLHDVLEDTKVTRGEVRSKFGNEVYEGVLALTKNAALPRPDQMKDSLRRILEQPPEVGMVKMADRITNLQRPPADWESGEILAYHSEAKLIHRTLKHLNEELADRLEARIEDYTRYLDLQQEPHA